VLIFIHPQGTAELSASGRLKGNGVLDNVIGNPLETTIALSHLILEGTLDAYPGLKICAARAGGYLPSYAARSDQGCVTFPQRCTKTLNKKPTEYLRQLYYDSLVFTPEGLLHLIAEVGASQIVMGTDYPFPWHHDLDAVAAPALVGVANELDVAGCYRVRDKLTRFGPFSSQCRAGNVKIRRGSWNEELFRVLEGYLIHLALDDILPKRRVTTFAPSTLAMSSDTAIAGARARSSNARRKAPGR
jgi:hypothetical protein